MQQPYTINLKPDTVPFSLKTPRRVPLSLMPKVKRELEKVERIGVIHRVEEPTDWCSGMVVVPKKTADPPICVDLTKLNDSVCQEKFILPIFSKFDCNMGFWQIPLAEECAKLTFYLDVSTSISCPLGLVRYYYTISHAPGKNLWTADTMPRTPLQADTSALPSRSS